MEKRTIKEIALDYIQNNECNFYANNKKVALTIFKNDVDVESIWYSKDEDKVYLHVGCEEFEGDIDIETLSHENQWMLKGALTGRWERFNGAKEPMELEFFSIEPDGKGGKQIHIWGYTYDYGDGTWRNVEYTGFIEPLRSFLQNYDEDDDYVNDTAAALKQYVGDLADDEVVDVINNYFDGHPADFLLKYCNVTMETPCGNYCFKA